MKKILVVLLLGLLAYELVAVYNQAQGDTISEITWTTILHRPFVPFLTGFVMGHLFWQEDRDD